MNAKDRQRSIREVEQHVQRLVGKGWRIECLTHTDEPDEPFRSVIRLAKDGPSVMEQPL